MGNKISSFDKLTMLKELNVGTLCILEHGKGYSDDDILAVDFLTIPLGHNGIVTDHLTLPICRHCVEALHSNEWVLLICTQCGTTRWVNRELSNLDYTNKETGRTHKIILMEGCPSQNCSGELTGIYYYAYDPFKSSIEVN